MRSGTRIERLAEYLRAVRGSRPAPIRAPAGHIRDHDRDCTIAVLSAAMAHRAGHRIINPEASDGVRREQERLAEQAHRYRDMSLIDLCRESCRLDGLSIPDTRDELIRRRSLNGVDDGHLLNDGKRLDDEGLYGGCRHNGTVGLRR